MISRGIKGVGTLISGAILALSAGTVEAKSPDLRLIPSRSITPAECPFEPGAAIAGRVQCGQLNVPENRENLAGKNVTIFFAVVQPEQQIADRDPILFVMGGNGSGLKNLKRQPALAHRLARNNTVIYVDHRGSTPWGKPDMSCAEFPEGLDAADPKADPAKVEKCRNSLASKLDINAFGAFEAAQDLRDLRIALGIDRWSVYGVSYGTTIAQRLNFIDGEAIKAIVFDGMSGVESNSFGKSFVLQPLAELLDECAAVKECVSAYPKLQSDLEKAAKALQRRPRNIGGERISNVEFLDQIRLALANPDLRGRIPLAISRAAKQDYEAWRKLANPEANSGGQDPAFTWPSSVCRDEFPRMERSDSNGFPTRSFDAAVVSGARMTSFETYDWARFCPRMGFTTSDPATIAVAKSDTPALFFAGQLDLVTPTYQSIETSRNFSLSTIIEFPLTWHFTLINQPECAAGIMLQFFDRPTAPIVRTCVDALPKTKWVTE